MTTIEIFKSAKIVTVDRIHKTITATGIDSVTRTKRTRTFDYMSDATLDKAERFLIDKTPLVVEVDSSSKNIGIRTATEHQVEARPSKLVRTVR